MQWRITNIGELAAVCAVLAAIFVGILGFQANENATQVVERSNKLMEQYIQLSEKTNQLIDQTKYISNRQLELDHYESYVRIYYIDAPDKVKFYDDWFNFITLNATVAFSSNHNLQLVNNEIRVFNIPQDPEIECLFAEKPYAVGVERQTGLEIINPRQPLHTFTHVYEYHYLLNDGIEPLSISKKYNESEIIEKPITFELEMTFFNMITRNNTSTSSLFTLDVLFDSSNHFCFQ